MVNLEIQSEAPSALVTPPFLAWVSLAELFSHLVQVPTLVFFFKSRALRPSSFIYFVVVLWSKLIQKFFTHPDLGRVICVWYLWTSYIVGWVQCIFLHSGMGFSGEGGLVIFSFCDSLHGECFSVCVYPGDRAPGLHLLDMVLNAKHFHVILSFLCARGSWTRILANKPVLFFTWLLYPFRSQ